MLLSLPWAAYADIYKCVDDSGRITYTNTKPSAQGCSVLSRDMPAARAVAKPAEAERPRDEQTLRSYEGASGSSNSGFPKVDAGTQQTRDTNRRSILERELASEEKLLSDARQEALRGYASTPGAKLSSDKVQLHERNIEALRKEISKLK